MIDAPSALDDVRVLDLTNELGAYCTKLLADLGADVIKIEPPGGDPTRQIGPFYRDDPDPEKSLVFFNLNTNKRSVALDLDSDDGREALRRLVPTADVVVDSLGAGVLDGLGLGYDGLRALRPDLIMTSISGFGSSGPHAGYLAPDIVGVAMGGIMWLAGDPQDPPNRPYGNQGYLSASVQAAAGTLMALFHRDVTGEGQRVDVSMQEALLIAQERAMQSYDLNKTVLGRTGRRGALPFTIPGIGPYEARDGWVWSYVGTPGGAPWSELLAWMDREGKAEELTDEPYRGVIEQLDFRFLTKLALDQEERKKATPVLQRIDDVLRAFFAAKGKWELYEEGQRQRVLIGIVSTPEDLVRNPQLEANAWLQQVEHTELGQSLRYPGPPYRLSRTPWRIVRRAPRLSEHTDEVLAEVGYSAAELESLRAGDAP